MWKTQSHSVPEVASMLYFSHIYIYTQSTHLCFSHHSEIAPCSPLTTEVGEVENGRKRQRNARKGESWPLGLNEASSVSEGAGGWTKWLIHFPRDPLPPSLRSQKNIHRHMHTLSLVDGSSNPGGGFYGDGNMASTDPEGAQSGWKVMAESTHCLSMCVFGCEDHRQSPRKYGRHQAPSDLLSFFLFFNLLTTETDLEKREAVQKFNNNCKRW